MNVFITGVAGFIGSHLAEVLLEQGHEVSGCDSLVTGKAENVPAGVRWLPAPVEDLRVLPGNVVVHLAAITSARWPRKAEVWEVNVGATAHAVRAAGGHFLFASTAAHATGSDYGRSKAAAEELVRAHGGHVLRLANVYGPRQRDWGPEPGVLAAWHRATREGRSIRVDGDGSQLRDFIHVFDVARAFVRAAVAAPGLQPGQTVDICTGHLSTIREAALSFAPERDWDRGERHPDDPDHVIQDPEPARRLFGFDSRIYPPWTAEAPS